MQTTPQGQQQQYAVPAFPQFQNQGYPSFQPQQQHPVFMYQQPPPPQQQQQAFGYPQQQQQPPPPPQQSMFDDALVGKIASAVLTKMKMTDRPASAADASSDGDTEMSTSSNNSAKSSRKRGAVDKSDTGAAAAAPVPTPVRLRPNADVFSAAADVTTKMRSMADEMTKDMSSAGIDDSVIAPFKADWSNLTTMAQNVDNRQAELTTLARDLLVDVCELPESDVADLDLPASLQSIRTWLVLRRTPTQRRPDTAAPVVRRFLKASDVAPRRAQPQQPLVANQEGVVAASADAQKHQAAAFEQTKVQREYHDTMIGMFTDANAIFGKRK
jgi:hypothetical protein